MSELLTTAQLAKRLQVSRDTVREWARDGRIPEIRISEKTRRFDLDEVMRSLRGERAEVARVG